MTASSTGSMNDSLVLSISLLAISISVYTLIRSHQERTLEKGISQPNDLKPDLPSPPSPPFPISQSSIRSRESFCTGNRGSGISGISETSTHRFNSAMRDSSFRNSSKGNNVDHHFGYDAAGNLVEEKEGSQTRRSRIPSSEFGLTDSLRRSSSADTLHSRHNAEIMPRTVTLIRHGESEGNVDPDLFQTKPDNAMRLTELGWVQARLAGTALRDKITNSAGETSIHFIVSPYVRTMETFHGIASAWCDPEQTFSHIKDRDERLAIWYDRLAEMGLTWHEDPRIREQDFGNYQDAEQIRKAKSERWEFGTFYYRFMNGESASDVFDRVSTFLDSLWRGFYHPHRSQNYVLVTHGISIRVLLSRYFRYTVDQFNMMKNPKNCEMIVLGHDGLGKLELDGRYTLEPGEEKDVTGCTQKLLRYKFYKTLDVGPKIFFKKRLIRMAFNESGQTQ